jgi:sarcosine oxidase subunit beta
MRKIAVIGGGAVGLAVAWRLALLNAGDIQVLEKDASLGQGSTSRANGGIRAQFGTRVNIQFSLFSIEAYEALQQEEPNLGLQRIGYLFMTGTKQGEATLRRNYTLQSELEIGTRWLTPAMVKSLAPFVRDEGLLAGTFRADDGILDPGGVAARLASEVRRAGVAISLNSEVTGIYPISSGGYEIQTASGNLRADVIVNCAGPYAAMVASFLEADIPVMPIRRNLACTEAIASLPQTIPMCVDLDTGVLIRREGAGVLIAYSDPADPPSWDTRFDESFLEAVAARSENRFPFLATATIDVRKCWAGLYPETPDHQPIIGEAPGRANFIQCVGFGGHGLMHAPAAGQAVAEFVVDGGCSSFDIAPFRPERFSEGRLEPEPAIL